MRFISMRAFLLMVFAVGLASAPAVQAKQSDGAATLPAATSQQASTVQEQNARIAALAEEALSTHWSKRDESRFTYSPKMGELQAVMQMTSGEAAIVELRGVRSLITPETLQEADTLNGIRWKGSVVYRAQLKREYRWKAADGDQSQKGWSDWVQFDKPFVQIDLEFKKGKWNTTFRQVAGDFGVYVRSGLPIRPNEVPSDGDPGTAAFPSSPALQSPHSNNREESGQNRSAAPQPQLSPEVLAWREKGSQHFRRGPRDASEYVEAMKWFQKAGESGDRVALGFVGWMYWHGLGVNRDPSAARQWFSKSAELGSAGSAKNLGEMYERGEGGTADKDTAKQWHTRALEGYLLEAEDGDAQSQYVLAQMYEHGQGTDVDFANALKWYEQSATSGNARAQNALGVMYSGGKGVAANRREAIRWFRRAAKQGDQDAITNLRGMGERP
jgi:TPR repeat protein